MPRIDLISPSFNKRKYIHNDLELPNLGRQHMKFEVEKKGFSDVRASLLLASRIEA